MIPRQLPPVSRSLQTSTTTEIFEPLTGWFSTLEAKDLLQVVLTLAFAQNFQCRLGIQTATKTKDSLNAATAFADVTLAAVLNSSGSQVFGRVDPNGASDGNIDTAMWFRLGVMYKAVGAGQSRGDVILEAHWR